jgi:pimeloyl-ACP methyl ester carboxylesterase
MAGGFAVTKEPGTDRFARRFHQAGFTVLAFDYRHLGESGGRPRLVVRVGEQLADWQAAIAFARSLPGVDPTRLAIWGFSLSGGHVLAVAARDPDLAAAIAQTPNADGPAAMRNAMRSTTAGALLRLTGRGVPDAVRGLLGRDPLLVLVCDQDRSALAGPAVRAARRAPRGELVRLPGGHYEPFMGGHERAVEAQLSFLHRYLVNRSRTGWASTAAS